MKKRTVYIFTLVTILASIFLNFFCTNGLNSKNKMSDDTKRPDYVPRGAIQIRFGSKDEPRIVWVKEIGEYIFDSKIYSHILGFVYYYSNTKIDTVYYENLDVRNGKFILSDTKLKMPKEQIDESTITLLVGKDSLSFFSVLGTRKFDENYNGVNLSSISTCQNVGNGNLIASSYLLCYLKQEKDSLFYLYLRDGTKVKYILNGVENVVTKLNVSFLNRSDGTIYLIDAKIFLKIQEIQNLNKINSEQNR